MKKKFLIAILMGIGMLFLSNSVFAQTEEMFEKQAEIDQVIFEEKYDEISEKGIFVTHTVALENKIEIGISPFSEDHASYLYELFGEENIVVVEGQEITTMEFGPGIADNTMVETTMAETSEESGNSYALYYIVGGVILVAAGFVIVMGKRRIKE